jgi:hypothetical protein
MAAKGNIRARVTQLQNVAAEEAGVTIESLIREAADIQQKGHGRRSIRRCQCNAHN